MSFPFNTSTKEGFVTWMAERQCIFLKKQAGQPKPWTDDAILRDNKFTNVYRQQDKGTIALMDMMSYAKDWPVEDQVWNVIWYRLFNHYELAELGPIMVSDEARLYEKLRDRYNRNLKVFTSAHMTTGVGGEAKVDTYIRASEDAVSLIPKVCDALTTRSMATVFGVLQEIYLVGRFVAYEIVCDLRFMPIWGARNDATTLYSTSYPADTFTWANMGPGACRGLTRLGLLELTPSGGPRYSNQAKGVELMCELLEYSLKSLPPMQSRWPFELREIEHSLCEFDKYERIRRHEGQARVKYQGRAE